MNEQQVLKCFSEGFDCSQVVLNSVAGELGIDEITAKKVSACFGGGMLCGSTCGAVTGALMAIGLKYGHSMPDTPHIKEQNIAKLIEFREKFLKKYDSIICKDLLGYNLTNSEDMKKIQEEELLTTFCPKLVADVISILKGIL
ncbi:C_GCAxxG_C_C family protein [Clostridium sporogenes]|uniref:C-GCAxxG-C-C family protein n=1 Tax=Clostridium sporogenes TaxID=1509 RepID=UPI0013D44D63|nr:C-GCAxxG-C-C family protein [Clostridium sporogenes]EJE7235523.1 C_GCAxxG_C_C family protein [Clostridium botulinum]EJE7236946.1 C_GCAxxG_C_C family protein [Clostridium botulinum]NFE79842.1 C_GCAxxG_C_C family protein [Clostridium sporogenes]NFG68391.1 C_GCAxxG_C_C family protein [Clostridium sporogenes]